MELGTKCLETRILFKKQATEEMKFLEWSRPTSYGLGAESHDYRYRTKFTLTPEGDSTRLTLTFDATPLTFMAKVMSVLMKPMMKMMTDMCGKDLKGIKRHVESLLPPTSGPPAKVSPLSPR